MEGVVLTVSDFVGLLNQTLEFAYPNITVQGELANFRVSKNKWVYFDLKDEYSSVKFFGTIYQLPGPLEDGMLMQVKGNPRLHNLYGFSVTVQTMQPVGEGSIKKAQALLQAKLTAEGLFEAGRKRPVPYPPTKIGLITSGASAAYHDFIKIINQRWCGAEIFLADVQVQGEVAPSQIVAALEHFNVHAEVDVIVITRGGGSAEDLGAFSTEQVTRAVAASRTPTVVAIGHEVDTSLAELAADMRASTPSNAAELLVPDKKQVLENLQNAKSHMAVQLRAQVTSKKDTLSSQLVMLNKLIEDVLQTAGNKVASSGGIIQAYNPNLALKRGYAIIKVNNKLLRSVSGVKSKSKISITLQDGTISAITE